MTDRLDSKSREDYIEYKLEKAHQAIEEAGVLAQSGFHNAAVNRLYYAAYYAASALMLENSLETATHKGVKTMLGLKFIRPGILEVEYGQIYQRLFDSRQSGDYEDFVYYTQTVYEELLQLARQFISRIEKLMHSK